VSLMNGNIHIHKEAEIDVNKETTEVESILRAIVLIILSKTYPTLGRENIVLHLGAYYT
jgi:hypothetical protein